MSFASALPVRQLSWLRAGQENGVEHGRYLPGLRRGRGELHSHDLEPVEYHEVKMERRT
jgi:hypothetical protein